MSRRQTGPAGRVRLRQTIQGKDGYTVKKFLGLLLVFGLVVAIGCSPGTTKSSNRPAPTHDMGTPTHKENGAAPTVKDTGKAPETKDTGKSTEKKDTSKATEKKGDGK